MSSMKSSFVPAVFRRKSERKSGNPLQQKTLSKNLVVRQDYKDGIISGVPEQLSGKYQDRGIKVSSEELNELRTFHTFISSHVKPNKICDTPCMLLWAEWVRFCLKEMRTFPHVILEKEFRDLVTNQFGFDVSEDEERGQVYPGIQFVSGRNITLDVIDRVSARA